MLLHDPQSKLTSCTESARVVDSVFLIIRVHHDFYHEDGEGRVCVFRRSEHANRIRQKLGFEWTVVEIHSRQIGVILSRPHICVGETYELVSSSSLE